MRSADRSATELNRPEPKASPEQCGGPGRQRQGAPGADRDPEAPVGVGHALSAGAVDRPHP